MAITNGWIDEAALRGPRSQAEPGTEGSRFLETAKHDHYDTASTKTTETGNSSAGRTSLVDRAPPEVVEQEKARLEDWKAKLVQLGEMLAALG